MKKRLWIVAITALILCISIGLTVFFVMRRQNELEYIREAALQELEEKKGEYNENVLVLENTSRAQRDWQSALALPCGLRRTVSLRP